jgi:hypothetical protein
MRVCAGVVERGFLPRQDKEFLGGHKSHWSFASLRMTKPIMLSYSFVVHSGGWPLLLHASDHRTAAH